MKTNITRNEVILSRLFNVHQMSLNEQKQEVPVASDIQQLLEISSKTIRKIAVENKKNKYYDLAKEFDEWCYDLCESTVDVVAYYASVAHKFNQAEYYAAKLILESVGGRLPKNWSPEHRPISQFGLKLIIEKLGLYVKDLTPMLYRQLEV